jgi:hypothetical protein
MGYRHDRSQVRETEAFKAGGAAPMVQVVGESEMVNRWSTGPEGPATKEEAKFKTVSTYKYLEEWPSGLRHRF